jgi:hypothetical protein
LNPQVGSTRDLGVRQRTWRKEFEDCEAQIHYQDLHTKVWYVIMYLISYKILYEIHTYMSNLCIIQISYNIQNIHTYARSILFNLNPNPNPINLKKENPNVNPRNRRKEIKSFFETNHLWNPKKTLGVTLRNGIWSFSNYNWKIK